MRDFVIEFEGDEIVFQWCDTKNFEIVPVYHPIVSNKL